MNFKLSLSDPSPERPWATSSNIWAPLSGIQENSNLAKMVSSELTVATTRFHNHYTHMKLLLSNCLGDYSCSFQGSSESIGNTVTVPCSSGREESQEKNSIRNYLQLQLHDLILFIFKNAMISKRMVCQDRSKGFYSSEPPFSMQNLQTALQQTPQEFLAAQAR